MRPIAREASRCVLVITMALLPATAAASTAGTGSTAGSSQALIATGGGTSSGTGGGGMTALPDLFTGALSHEAPIDLPPGRNGLTPHVGLTYRSGNGNGFLGVGWDLELGSVERSLKGGVNFAGDDHVLRFGGASSDLVYIGIDTGTYREYRAKIEDDFKRVRRLTAADGRPYFEVTDRAGTRYLYGQTVASRQDNPANGSQIFKWCLDMVIDVHGNFFTIAYWKDQGEIYPDTISYAGYRKPGSTWNPNTGSPGPGDLLPVTRVRVHECARAYRRQAYSPRTEPTGAADSSRNLPRQAVVDASE